MCFAGRVLRFFTLVAAISLIACGGGDNVDSNSASNTTSNTTEACVSELVGKNIPAGYASYFCSVKITSICSSDTSCTITYTYENGAQRNVVMTATPNQQYTPTAQELEITASYSNPVYNALFSAVGWDVINPPETTQLQIGYFLPSSSVPSNKASKAIQPGLPVTMLRAPGSNDGFQISWSESGQKGADVAIGSIIDHFEKLGRPVKATGSVYALASAVSDTAGALLISPEISAWLAELDSLEQCAADPTNPLTQTDPNYTADTVARIGAARTELKKFSAMRYLNIMDETAAGLTPSPAMAVLSIPLKQAHAYVEQTMKTLSESLMRDIRASVVSCKPTCPTSLVATGVSESQIDLSWIGSIGDNVVTGYHITGVGANALTTAMAWSATGLARSTTYCYTVSAYNDYGTAENCPEACAQTMGPPVVNATTPYAGSNNVSVTTTVTATFSEAMDATTISTNTFTLAGTSAIAGSVSYNVNTKTVTFTPSAPLENGKTYTATINTGVADVDGVAMEQNFTWSFTTEIGAPSGNVTFTGNLGGLTATNGSASVNWTLVEDLGDVRTYEASGTISADVSLGDSNIVRVTSNIIAPSQLKILTASNALAPNTYSFKMAGEPFTVTFTSGGVSLPITGFLSLTVGYCGTSFEPQPISDYSHLAGSYSCVFSSQGNDVTWDFNAF